MSKNTREAKGVSGVEKKMVVEVVENGSGEGDLEKSGETVESLTDEVMGMSGLASDKAGDLMGDGRKRSGLLLVAVSALVILSVSGWLMYLRSEWMRRQELAVNQETVEELAAEQVTGVDSGKEIVEEAVKQLSREEISLEILNGSGMAGLAQKTKEVFEELGYRRIKVGNAEGAVGNKLFLRPDYEGRVEVLMGDALSELEIATVAGELGVDEETIVRIVLGR